MSEEKITQIQETLAHQEQMINTLNDVVTKQWDEIDLLKKRVKRLQEELANGLQKEEPLSAAEQAARDKPPHY